MGFEGIPVVALDFYEDLEDDNTKSFWTAHKHVYDEQVRAPLQALVDRLEPEFGTAKLFRPYRDVRYAKDKTPYKTHQGAYVAVTEATGWYVEVNAAGVRVGGGCYHLDSARVDRFRTAVDDGRKGNALRRTVEGLEADGFEVGGDTLKTRPRGYDEDHPRIRLLRHKTLHAGRLYDSQPWVHTAALADRVADDWRLLKPLVDWIDRHCPPA